MLLLNLLAGFESPKTPKRVIVQKSLDTAVIDLNTALWGDGTLSHCSFFAYLSQYLIFYSRKDQITKSIILGEGDPWHSEMDLSSIFRAFC